MSSPLLPLKWRTAAFPNCKCKNMSELGNCDCKRNLGGLSLIAARRVRKEDLVHLKELLPHLIDEVYLVRRAIDAQIVLFYSPWEAEMCNIYETRATIAAAARDDDHALLDTIPLNRESVSFDACVFALVRGHIEMFERLEKAVTKRGYLFDAPPWTPIEAWMLMKAVARAGNRKGAEYVVGRNWNTPTIGEAVCIEAVQGNNFETLGVFLEHFKILHPHPTMYDAAIHGDVAICEVLMEHSCTCPILYDLELLAAAHGRAKVAAFFRRRGPSTGEVEKHAKGFLRRLFPMRHRMTRALANALVRRAPLDDFRSLISILAPVDWGMLLKALRKKAPHRKELADMLEPLAKLET